MNRAYDILTNGGLPFFEEYGVWPNNELTIRDASVSGSVAQDFGSWIAGPTDVERVELEGNRIVALESFTGTGEPDCLRELSGVIDGDWQSIFTTSDGVADYQLDGDQTGVLLDDGRLMINTGDGVWHSVRDNVTSFQVDGTRLGAIVRGELMVQDGGPLAPWTTIFVAPTDVRPSPPADFRAERVVRFQLDGDRVAVLTSIGVPTPRGAVLRIGEGLATGIVWHDVWSQRFQQGQGSTVAFALDGDRVGVLLEGQLSTLEGPLGPALSTWTVQQTGIASFQMKGDCTAVLSTTGDLLLQKDDFTEPWEPVRQDVVQFELAGYNALWPDSADPLLSFQLSDQTVLTNRDTVQWPGQTLPHSQQHAMPGPLLASAFGLEQTVPYPDPEGAGDIKIEDRLAVLVGGALHVMELGRFKVEPTPTLPPVSLSRFDGPVFDRVQLDWSNAATAGPKDYVALYDENPFVAGPDGYLFGQWQWATNGPNWVSTTEWAQGFYIAYVREDASGTRTIVNTWGPTTSALADLDVLHHSGVFGDFVEIGWEVTDPGGKDYVALYDQHPLSAGPNGHLLAQWQWANKGPLWLSAKRYAAGYYAAYIQQDASGARTIVAIDGPTTTSNANVWLTKSGGWLFDWVQLNWTVTRPGYKDYVALYDKDPNTAGPNGYLTLQWEWANQGPNWVSAKLWNSGYWVAYIQEDAQGNRTILDTWGPTP